MKKITFFNSDLAIYLLWIVSFIGVASFFIFIFIAIPLNQNNEHRVVSNGVVGSSSLYNDNLKPIDEIIPESLPFNKYEKLNDSINFVRNFKNGGPQNAVFSPFGGAMKMKFVMDKEVDHVRPLDLSYIEVPDRYFYVIKGWKMKSEEHPLLRDYTYYVKNGVPYFRKYIFKSSNGKVNNFEMKEKRLNYFCDRDNKTILIPISKDTYAIVKYTSIFLMFVFASISLVSVLLMFKILFNISRGKVFIEENIKILRQAAFITFLLPVIIILINLCQKLIFYKYFDDNVVLDIDFYEERIYFLFVGIAVSVLYKVFKRGFYIQKENDLVV